LESDNGRGKESLGSRCKGKISAGSKYKKKDGSVILKSSGCIGAHPLNYI
jgi:NADH:ubiquinone oxidoreductase subunit E